MGRPYPSLTRRKGKIKSRPVIFHPGDYHAMTRPQAIGESTDESSKLERKEGLVATRGPDPTMGEKRRKGKND